MYNSFVREEQAENTKYLPYFCVDVPANRDSPTRRIHAVSQRDETSPGGYFAFLLPVKDVGSENIFNISFR